MYYPYFRGKQFDLLAVRESAGLLADSRFVAVIEPVRESFSGLKRSVEALSDAGAEVVLIVNPFYGDHSRDSQAICSFVANELDGKSNVSIGFLLTQETTLNDAISICDVYSDRSLYFIHFGFSDPRGLLEVLQDSRLEPVHIFADEYCGKRYQKYFSTYRCVLLRDGFKRQANRKYPDVERFSDLHTSYRDEGVNGFGDFLIVGDEYSESGGPAYAVAIHLTFIDPEKDDEMFVYHFKSDRQDTPTDPAGKFYEALSKLVDEVNKPGSKILRTAAVDEFLDLYKRAHFPGLGHIKKLSMKHHLEVLAKYLRGGV